MRRHAVTTIILIPFLLSMAGCYDHEVKKTSQVRITPRYPDCPTQPLTLANPLVMTSIGVNRYGKTAGVWSTAAHLLSAAIFHEPFKVAAEKTKQQLRNKMAFGNGSPVVLDGISTTINKLVFSEDGSQLAATSQDGIAGVWSLKWMSASDIPYPMPGAKPVYAEKSSLIYRFPKSPIRYVGFVKHHGAQALLFMDDAGHGELVTRDGMSTLAEFQHPGPARYMEVDATGSRILTVGNDFTVQIWSLSDLSNPAQLTLPAFLEECHEPEKLRAFFSNDGEHVLVTHSLGVCVYSVHDLNHPAFSYKLPGDELENIVEISRDGQSFLWINRKGELYLRRINSDKERTISVKQGFRFKFVRPTISQDGKVFGQQHEGGGFTIWREGDKRGPLWLAGDRRVGQLSLSAGGEGGVAQSKNAVFAWDLRVWDGVGLGLSDLERQTIPSLLLHSYILRQDTNFPLPTTAVIDPLGEKVAIGFESGRIELYGARTSPNIESLSSISLVADHWLPRKKFGTMEILDPTVVYMAHLGGDDTALEEYEYGELAPEMTSQKIWEAIRKALHQAEWVYGWNGFVLIIVYMSGHGLIGSDGESYFLPGDANESDSASWISYSSIVREIEGFVGNNPKKRAAVIFDTCQKKRGEAGQPVRRIRTSSPYVTLVQSASPGQYAWQYGSPSSYSGEMKVNKEMRHGFPRPPKAERGKIEGELETYMSVLPIGNKCYLNNAAEQRRKEAQATGIAPDEEVLGVNLLDWLSGAEKYARHFLELTPESTEYEKRFGKGQDIVMDISEENKSITIFMIDSEDI